MRLRSISISLLLAAALCPACTKKAHPAPVTPGSPTEAPAVAPVAEPVAPVELEVIGDLANRTVEAEAAGEVLARIQIRSPQSNDAERPRANIGLVVDTSASMDGDAIEQARAAALTLLSGLRDGDMLSVVVFGSVTEVLVPATELTEQTRPKIRAAIETMKATGTTDLAGGLNAGLQQVQSQARSGEINRIVLVSDGVPNDDSQVVGLAQQARNVGVSITALGLGLDYHETLLGQIAQASGGKFHFVENPTEVAAVFSEEVLSIDRLAATGIMLTLTPGPGVTILEVPGQAISHNGRSAMVGLPDMAEGETRQVIVKLAVGEHADGATVELLDGVVNYADARLGTAQQRQTFLAAKATADADERQAGLDLEVAIAAARATTAAATLAIVSMARSGQVEQATRTLDDTVKNARALSDQMPDAQLAQLIDGLVELRPTLPGLAPPPPPKAAIGNPRPVKRKGKGTQPRPQSMPVMATDGGVQSGTLGLGQARGVRANHERAYNILHGG